MQQSSTGYHRLNLVLFFQYNQRWFYFKEAASLLTGEPTCNICMHVCPYITYWTLISTKTDLTSILVSSRQMLFSELWTFRSPSRLLRVTVVWSFPQSTFHCLAEGQLWEVQATANLQQKWKTAKVSVIFLLIKGKPWCLSFHDYTPGNTTKLTAFFHCLLCSHRSSCPMFHTTWMQ